MNCYLSISTVPLDAQIAVFNLISKYEKHELTIGSPEHDQYMVDIRYAFDLELQYCHLYICPDRTVYMKEYYHDSPVYKVGVMWVVFQDTRNTYVYNPDLIAKLNDPAETFMYPWYLDASRYISILKETGTIVLTLSCITLKSRQPYFISYITKEM